MTIVANQGYALPVGRYYLLALVAVSRGDVMVVNQTVVNANTGLFDEVAEGVSGDSVSGIPAVAEADIVAGKRGWFVTDGTSIEARVVSGVTVGEDLGTPLAAREFVAVGIGGKIVAKAKVASGAGGIVSTELAGSHGFGQTA